jgi:Spy/CpxP family protein refolding chaperone
MKKFLAIALLGLSIQVAQAQTSVKPETATVTQESNDYQRGNRGNKTPEERAKAQVARLTKKLNLSSEQQNKVYDITYGALKEGEEMRKNAGNDRNVMREKRKAMMADTDIKIKAVLNADQAKKFEQMKAERQARMEEKMNERRHGGGNGQHEMGY